MQHETGASGNFSSDSSLTLVSTVSLEVEYDEESDVMRILKE